MNAVRDSRGIILRVGNLVYSFGWGDNYIIAEINTDGTRIRLEDSEGQSVGWADPDRVAFVALSDDIQRT